MLCHSLWPSMIELKCGTHTHRHTPWHTNTPSRGSELWKVWHLPMCVYVNTVQVVSVCGRDDHSAGWLQAQVCRWDWLRLACAVASYQQKCISGSWCANIDTHLKLQHSEDEWWIARMHCGCSCVGRAYVSIVWVCVCWCNRYILSTHVHTNLMQEMIKPFAFS